MTLIMRMEENSINIVPALPGNYACAAGPGFASLLLASSLSQGRKAMCFTPIGLLAE